MILLQYQSKLYNQEHRINDFLFISFGRTNTFNHQLILIYRKMLKEHNTPTKQ